MSELKPNAHEDKDVEPVSDSSVRTQEPLQSHTSSLKNNAAGLSSDEHENPLNGTQPNPFVYSSVPAVPHAGNSLPSGALVNGPGSHPTSEVHCVLNKGTVLSNNVLDAAWQAEKDTSPEVLPPPSELQSDAWKNTAGPVVKTLATQPGVNMPLSHSEENESKLAYSTLSGDSAEQMRISQPLTKQTMKTRSRRDVEWSESSLDDYDDAEVIRRDSARERLSHNDRRLESDVMHRRDKKHNTHVKNMSGSAEKVNNSLNQTHRRFCLLTSNDVGNVDIPNKKDDSLGRESDVKYSVVPFKDLSRNTASDSEHFIYSTAQESCNEENDPEDEDNFSPKVSQMRTEQAEQDFFSCAICKVNFKERICFRRHMMFHLDEHNQVNCENVSQPFICRECGRLFCDSNSLMSHIIIHQDRLEKLMEEIKGLENTKMGDRQCPVCVFACNCPKIFVQHAKTHNNLKHYYFCEECNYITLTQQALEAHLYVTHLNTHQPQYRKMTHTNDAQELDQVQFQHKMGYFRSKEVLQGHSEPEHQQSQCGNYQKAAYQHKTAGSDFGEAACLTHLSSKKEGIYIQKSNEKTINSPQFKGHFSFSKNMLSPSSWRVDRNGKLLLQPGEKLHAATDLTCVEGDAVNDDREASGSSKQANCPATADTLRSARNPKLDQMFCEGSRNSRAGVSLQAQAKQNSPSLRKMSTPLLNTVDNLNGNKSPRLSQRLQKQSEDEEFQKGCESRNNFSDGTVRATGSFLESSENERKLRAWRCFRKRQRFSDKDQNSHILKNEDEEDEDCSDIEQLVIKEECVETAVCDDSPESPCMSTSDSFEVFPTLAQERKPCPYCPAVFESGVGLSNHVRGHLHRVGLSYNARHMVSPEQVALQDHQPRIRRRITCGTRRMRRAVKKETKGQHICPLCCGWFDTKTGLSNHVRGHLKRIGRGGTSTSKSPLCILNELLQDRKEHASILQVLNKSHFLSRSFVSQKLFNSNSKVLMSIPVKIQCERKSPHPILDSFVPKEEAEVVSGRKKLHVEAKRGTKASQSTLVELLKMRQESLELTAGKNQEADAARKFCDYMEETRTRGVQPNWADGECDLNKFLIQCRSSFSRFPAHLQAYAHRRRIGLFEGYNDKQKKPRLRPGLKKKILPSLNAEIYTLTCRFCDLVFQGPASVQEDWIRHLQRHLLHTSVPHSGTRMVEILGLDHETQTCMSGEQPDLQSFTGPKLSVA